ncbi:Clan CD, family C14, metacaspase-like cysteine peptidase [Histomonas meleagridis]|uniref:Clan CD, family C14, metacaspase-like cysteine peptidase n=1 Tax=Histomonas meleagridis TaxID=135588 RepID=UPI00355970B7|nr:Clan CD, family C14, metacaspase-like cysteine peptidase [Histomonas meleagridis]KAH0804663.1 Clan CD, family C14, metacaspase-like cysteine peptidase [Histomonas meleagridis]
MYDPVGQLRSLGRDLSKIPSNRMPLDLKNVCLICVNSYRSFRQNIGTTPINDAATMAKCVKYFEYEVYYLHNPHAQRFLEFIDYFFENTQKNLIVYYVGQGTTASDLDNTQPHDFDEAFTFEDGIIYDEDMIEHLQCKAPSNKIILITDTCRQNTCWSIKSPEIKGYTLPERVISLSASPRSTTSKQMMALCQSQGIFTFNLTKELKLHPKITPNELLPKMNSVLSEYVQDFNVGSSSPELLDEPIIDYE